MPRTPQRPPSRVTFHEVSILEFPRSLSHLAVPSDGNWPLGLAPWSSEVHTSVVSVEQYASDQQDRIQKRLNAKLKASAQSKRRAARKLHKRLERLAKPLETRPWDYKPEEDNPLFEKLEEEDREDLLLVASSNETSGSPTETKQLQRAAEKIRQDLESLRESRSTTGCSCCSKQTKTWMKAQKKVEADQVTNGSIELSLPPSCCTADSCPCIQAGIRCDSMACRCCGCGQKVEACGNPNGMCVYLEDEINQYRADILKSLPEMA